MRDPEPTIEYAMDSQWQEMVSKLGFYQSGLDGTPFFTYNSVFEPKAPSNWSVQALWGKRNRVLQRRLVTLCVYCRQPATANIYMGVLPRDVYKVANLLIGAIQEATPQQVMDAVARVQQAYGVRPDA